MAKRVTVSFLLDDDADIDRDQVRDEVQDIIIRIWDAASQSIDVDIQEGVLDGPT